MPPTGQADGQMGGSLKRASRAFAGVEPGHDFTKASEQLSR